MRLSPKSIFIGLIALGLPFAVALGWMLGATGSRAGQPRIAGAPGGAGTIGAAPARGHPTEPVNPVRYDVRRPAAQTSALPSAPAPPPATAPPPSAGSSPSPGGPLVTLTTLPPLTHPPVPTPTTVTSGPPSSSATPSGSTSSTSGGLLFRRR
ncbi:hypothetical protein [Actinoplanes sp. NPDC049265]|uniref:hypothetical protein n=1 Tax=Actinoplanes sp. NPDC049265 TaxID=3363902 RepID=UPI0037129265